MNNTSTKLSTKKKIMVADDDPAILDAIKLMLETVGYEVDTTVNGETVRKMVDNLPDLLLLDIWMSGQDGRNICRHLKSKKKTQHIPIIMISANKDTEKIAKEAGADDFLAKPFEMDDLLNKIATHLK
ncbi:MAG: response regulator [Candidatus Levyibacteriota bacterium]